MITFDSISLQRGNKVLLEHTSAVFHSGQKVALIGANGSGKSSLFQLLLGQLSVDDGTVSIPQQWRIAHMAQEVGTSVRNALDYVLDGDTTLRKIEAEIDRAQSDNNHHLLAALHEQLDSIDGYNARIRAQQLLQGLGFQTDDAGRPVNSFSGGWRIRLNLAQALMSPSDLLLLDEPTNHLDLDAELWLEQWLQRYDGSLLLISHDRDFIDSVCETVVHIEHTTLNTYRGNYSSFEHQRSERLAQQQANYEKQQQRIAQIQSFVDRFRAKATKARQAQSRLKELARMEKIAPAHIDSPFDFQFPLPEKFSDPLLNLTDADLGYADKKVISHVNLSIHPGSRIGLLGANGAGKSTLIKSLANEINLINGEYIRGENLQLGYFSQHQLEALDLNASPLLHLQRLSPQAREQDIRNFLGGFNFHGDMALAPIQHFSGGEKARLALAIIVWQKPNLLLLDEPTNHLDLDMCHALTVALQAYEGAVVVVSHDRHLLRNTVDQFLLVANGKATHFDGDLHDYSKWLLERRKNNNTGNGKNNSDSNNRKEQRQQAAQVRKTLSPINNAIKKIEKAMIATDNALQTVETALADSTVYEEKNKNKLQQLLKDQENLSQEKALQEEQWLELNEQLEELTDQLQK